MPASSPSLRSPNAVFGCGVPDLEDATEFTAEGLFDAMRVSCVGVCAVLQPDGVAEEGGGEVY